MAPTSKKALSNKRSKLRKGKAAADAEKNAINSKLLRRAAKSSAEKALLKIEPPKSIDKYDKPDFLQWIFSIPFSRKLRFLPKDFSDGVLVAEIVKHYAPTKVELHSYLPSVGKKNKTLNWVLLNRKVFSRYFKMTVKSPLIQQFVSPSPTDAFDLSGGKWYPIEKFLVDLRDKLVSIFPKLYDYRENPLYNMNNLPRPKKLIRPLSRQPITDSMWRLERQSAAKYGRYKGNPITWDDVPEYYEKATLLQLGVGISTEKFRKIQEYWHERKLKEEAKKAEKLSSAVDTNKTCSDLQSTSTCPLSHVTPTSIPDASHSNSNICKANVTSSPASLSASSQSVSTPGNQPLPTKPKKYKINCPVPCSIETDFPVSFVCSPDSTKLKIVSVSPAFPTDSQDTTNS